MKKFSSISEVSKILNLIDPVTKKPQNHILRYWEKEFKIIKPKKFNKIRHYSTKQIEILKMIKYLLKMKGMTVSGAKNLLQYKINKLDDVDRHGLNNIYLKDYFKTKSKNILDKINKIKNYGKKNTS